MSQGYDAAENGTAHPGQPVSQYFAGCPLSDVRSSVLMVVNGMSYGRDTTAR